MVNFPDKLRGPPQKYDSGRVVLLQLPEPVSALES
jgi:hypothetical protein